MVGKVFIDVIFSISLTKSKNDIKHYSVRRFEKGQTWKLQLQCLPAACLCASRGGEPKEQQLGWKIWTGAFLPGGTGAVTHQQLN